MSSIEATELKLKTSPTGGADPQTSPYYRRLVSAGYKGFLQGTIGGASLYGVLGLAVGGLVAMPLAALGTGVGLAAFWLIPVCAAAGVLKGASTFGSIGTVAAINAESADLSEQRRYLLDRYYDLPEGPEGDREAEVIKKELMRQHENVSAPSFFHWKTVAIGAIIGAGLALALFATPALAMVDAAVLAHIGEIAAGVGLKALIGTQGAITALGVMVGTSLGAAAGATIGIDRYYIRKWFDHTEGIVHASTHRESALIERSEQIERLKAAHREDQKTQQKLQANEATSNAKEIADAAIAKAQQSSAATVANKAAAPTTHVQASSVSRETLERRAEALQGIEI